MALLTWTFAHAGLTHYLSNVVVILLVAPLIEDRYGSLPACWASWLLHR